MVLEGLGLFREGLEGFLRVTGGYKGVSNCFWQFQRIVKYSEEFSGISTEH